MQAIKDAEAIGPSFDYLGAQGTVRHFYEHVNMPENYVVLGDALAHLNPRFGSGMSAAAFQVQCCHQLISAALPLLEHHTGYLSTRLQHPCSCT